MLGGSPLRRLPFIVLVLANRIATDAEAEAKAVRFAADAEAARIAVEAKAEAVAARKIAAEAAPFIVLLCSHLNANRLRENSTSFGCMQS